MLTNIMYVIVGVFFGNVLFYISLFAMCMSKKFLKWYTKRVMKKSVEIGDELVSELDIF